jgi:hypothetical protein
MENKQQAVQIPASQTITVRYLNEKQVAEITGRSLQTLRNDRFKGQGIPYVKVGRSVRYLYGDVVTFMEAGRIQTKAV